MEKNHKKFYIFAAFYRFFRNPTLYGWGRCGILTHQFTHCTVYSTGQCGIVTHQYTHCTVRVGSVWYPNPLVYTLYCWGQCGVLTHLYTQCTDGVSVVS